jgi:DeoR family deoxyribose operon repressor
MQRGATCAAFHEAEVKKKAIALARESYLVADSSKMGKLQRAFFAPVDAFKAIITEHGEMPAAER